MYEPPHFNNTRAVSAGWCLSESSHVIALGDLDLEDDKVSHVASLRTQWQTYKNDISTVHQRHLSRGLYLPPVQKVFLLDISWILSKLWSITLYMIYSIRKNKNMANSKSTMLVDLYPLEPYYKIWQNNQAAKFQHLFNPWQWCAQPSSQAGAALTSRAAQTHQKGVAAGAFDHPGHSCQVLQPGIPSGSD